MTHILCIETATSVCSVALIRDQSVISIRESARKNAHAEYVSVFMDEVIQEAGLSFSDLDAVAVSKGPGSYTGLRIGVSSAKGLCYSQDIPLIAISTPRSMAAGMIGRLIEQGDPISGNALCCPMIDARRMEVYDALYEVGGIRDLRGIGGIRDIGDIREIRKIRAEVIYGDSFKNYLGDHIVLDSVT